MLDVLPTVATTASGMTPAARSARIALGEPRRLHPEFGVRGNPRQRVVSETEQDDRLVDRRVRVLAAVDANAAQPVASGEPGPAHVRHRRLARRGQRVQRRDRGRVVDDAVERVGKPDQPPQPAERDLFQLGRRRRRPPQHRLLVECRRQELGQHTWLARADGEVGEETGMVPVRQAGNEDALEVGEDALERFALLGRAVGQRAANLSRAYPREDRISRRIVEVVGDPVGEEAGVISEVGQSGNRVIG